MLAIRLCDVEETAPLLSPLTSRYSRAPVFRGPRWQARCLCRPGRHVVVPETDGNCGLYACITARVRVTEREFALRILPEDVVWGHALVLVECLGRTIYHDNGVLRSAVQVPQHIWLTPYWAWARTGLEREYDCPVVVTDHVPDECMQFRPGVGA